MSSHSNRKDVDTVKRSSSGSPVIIVGAERSGTSILYRTIQQHPKFSPVAVKKLAGVNVSYASGVSLTESHVFIDPQSIFIKESLAFEYLLEDEEVYDNLMKEVRYLKLWQTSISGEFLNKIYFKYNWPIVWRILGYSALIRSYFAHAVRARKVSRIVEKTPTSILRLSAIINTYPNAKLLFIYRHPVDVLVSMRRRSDAEYRFSENFAFQNICASPDVFVGYYANYMQVALEERRKNVNFLMLKYENFVSEPERCLARVFQFLGESWSKRFLPRDDSERSDWDRDPQLFREITRVREMGEVNAHITCEEAEIVERGLGEIMKELDYSHVSQNYRSQGR